MRCHCGHRVEWDHYKRSPGNGQQYDWVCVGCLTDQHVRPHDINIHPWHAPQEEDCGAPFAGGAYTCSKPRSHTGKPGDAGHGDCDDCDSDKGTTCKRHREMAE